MQPEISFKNSLTSSFVQVMVELHFPIMSIPLQYIQLNVGAVEREGLHIMF